MFVREASASGESVLVDSSAARRYPRGTVLAAYVVVTKPRIMSLLLFTTLAALLIAVREHPLPSLSFLRVLLGTVAGGACAAGGAAALNCYIDRDIDEVMARTRRRPIPAGILTPRQVLVFGLALSAASLLVLVLTTNIVAAGLALAGNVFYVVIYTAWLKRSTTQNIVIGGVAGAIPPLVGWAAVTGSLAFPALLLLVIITYWTPAHFWSLALSMRHDYSRACIPMLPSVTTEAHATWQILVYTLLVVIASLLLFSVHAMGYLYLVAAAALGTGFIYQAVRLMRSEGGRRQAHRTFMYSNIYLAALFTAMILDRLIA
jgi:protoheme IX farnesyltransferase